jgi:hypothetical protein
MKPNEPRAFMRSLWLALRPMLLYGVSQPQLTAAKSEQKPWDLLAPYIGSSF